MVDETIDERDHVAIFDVVAAGEGGDSIFDALAMLRSDRYAVDFEDRFEEAKQPERFVRVLAMLE